MFAAFDAAFAQLDEHRIETVTSDYRVFAEALVGLIRDADQTYGSAATVGIGINGIVDPSGRSYSVNVPCINGKQVPVDLGGLLGRPVQCINDVRAFALSEANGGAGHAYRTMAGVILGTGAMGTLCVDGEVQSGAGGVAGEWGHLPIAATLVERHKLPLFSCACGQTACAECYVSGPGLGRLATHYLGENVDSHECIARMRAGDTHADGVFDIWVDLVAGCLAQIVLHVDPDVIIVGGGMSTIDEFYERLTRLWPNHVFEGVKLPPVLPARFGATSGVRGAYPRLMPGSEQRHYCRR